MNRPANADRTPVRERLGAARESRGLDRAAAAKGAGVPLRYLAMLEAGEYPLVADPAYLSPYVRRYAAFLELPAEETVIAFLAENEANERRAAAALSVPPPPGHVDEQPTWLRPLSVAAAVLAIVGAVSAALVDGATLGRWLGVARPQLDRAAVFAERVASASAATVRGRLGAAEPSPPVRVAAAVTAAPREESPAEAAPLEPTLDASAVVVTAMTAPTPPPMATAPAATTPMQISEAPPQGATHRLDLLATARQVFVWVTIDGAAQREVELRRGESASFEAKGDLVISLDDAGGVRASLNGRRLAPFGAEGYGRRNIRIPLEVGAASDVAARSADAEPAP